ncbi:universal stress protein [Pedobacter nyackensis]|uniref:universal stress protein n=1 Tax=Pedobacter nyackensis TaxID=475255 RepID=UPI00292EA6CC|nr:universal stress protein [Pedobacter nyackensis]
METIIVTTDLSVNSKAAIRFAINLARARKAQLIVLHIYHVLRPTIWSENAYQVYKQSIINQTEKDITVFVKKIINSMNLSDVNFRLIMKDHVDATEGILEFIAAHTCNYICIGTRGAGAIKKIIGTHTSRLIIHSSVPVICIPSGYRNRPFKRLLYATDMNNYEAELIRLVDFVRPLQAELRMLHMAAENEFILDTASAEESLEKKMNYKVEVVNHQRNVLYSVLQEINIETKQYKPSMIAFFTHQNRSLLDKLILPSNAAEFSFYSQIPMISFKKG